MDIEKNNIDVYPLVLSKKFVKILKKINDNVSQFLIQKSKEKIKFKETFIDRTEKEDSVTFITSDKVNKLMLDKSTDLDECWTNHQRVEIKIGRLIYKLIGDKIKPQEIENFVNDYKAIIKAKGISRSFKIIEGDELKKWYLQDNNSIGTGGNISNSCMRYKFCQSFMDIYSKNPEKIKLLILLDETKEKILGRALLWKLNNPRGKIFMDRVYFSNDFILNMFINHAIKNGWLYKLESMNNVMQVVYNNKIIRTTLAVKINKLDYDLFPFVDNLGFYDPVSGILSNNPKYLRKMNCEEYYDLCDVTGGFEVRSDFDF